QVEVAHKDDESVLDPLLNAPCFGCKNTDSSSTMTQVPGASGPQPRCCITITGHCPATSPKRDEADRSSNRSPFRPA
ncbi:hypothetical protein B0T18DRAFT_321918, partial [Schizothecium vesticola]